MKDFITIKILDQGEIRTEVSLPCLCPVELVGIALASASRVCAMAMARRYEGTQEQSDQVLARIRDVYNKDLIMGDIGEEKSFSIIDPSATQ